MCFIKVIWILIVVLAMLEIGWCRNNHIRRRIPKDSSVVYYTEPQQKLTVKIKIHYDNILTQKLSKEYGRKTKRTLKLLAKEIVSQAEDIFRHPSLNQEIEIQLQDTRLLKNNTKKMEMNENASRYLRSYCDWQSVKKADAVYYSVLFTGLDLFYLNSEGKEVRRSTGRSYMNGICRVKNSCAVIEWRSKNLGYLLAHEIAHSLGIHHDGSPYNKCKPKGDMMGGKYDAKKQPKSWSSCSRMALKKTLRSKRARCLQKTYANKPSFTY